MEMWKENGSEKRKRKRIERTPVLVRSVKPGQALAATYSREQSYTNTFWKR
jgi:hypothetical protein